MEFYLTTKKNANLRFAGKWLYLEIIIQTKKVKY